MIGGKVPIIRHMRILVVEDSAIDRRKVGGYLKDWGLDHVMVGTGTEAAEILEQPDPPTMALLDWVLPGHDGIELCRRYAAGYDRQHRHC